MFAQTLGLPGEFVTGKTLTTRIRFAPNSNEMINAALYGSPSLGHAAVVNNNDPDIITNAETMSILPEVKLVFDTMKDSRATVTKDINNLMDVNQNQNVYPADEWVTQSINGIVNPGNYTANVNVNAGQSPKFIVIYFQYNPPLALPAAYDTSFFTPRNVLPYRPPKGTVFDIDVKYNYNRQTIRNLSFDEGSNSVCENMYKILRDKRTMHVGSDFTSFKDFRDYYPVILVPDNKSHADINLPGQTSSLDNGVVNVNVALTNPRGGPQFENNITMRELVISEAWQVTQNSRTGVYRISSGELINNGFLRSGTNFAYQVRRNIAQRVGITEGMLQ